MSYTPGLENGAPAAGANLPPDAEGGQGWLSAIYVELQRQNRLLEEIILLLVASEEKENDAG